MLYRLGCTFVIALLCVLNPAFGNKALAQDNQIEIAVAVPLSGEFADLGKEIRDGATVAETAINSGGGVNGRLIHLTFFDDKGVPQRAAQIAREISRNGTHFVIGHYNSGSSIAAAKVYAKNDVLMISPASTNPALTASGGWNVIRTSGRDDLQGAYGGSYMIKHFPGKSIMLIGDGTPYADGIISEAEKALSAGKASFSKLSIKAGQTNFSKIVNTIKSKGIDIIFFAGLGDEYRALVREARKQQFGVYFIGVDGTLGGQISDEDIKLLNETLITYSRNDAGNPAAAEAVRQLRAMGSDDFAYSLKSYAAVQVLVEGMRKAQSINPRAVSKTIKSGETFPTVLGPLSFDKNGDRNPTDIRIYVWRGRLTEAAE